MSDTTITASARSFPTHVAVVADANVPNPAEIEQLYQAALQADILWSRELRRIYGRSAGDARYDFRGRSTPLLRELKAKKLDADSAWRAALYDTRETRKVSCAMAA